MLLLLHAACADPKPEGPYALAFGGAPDCVEVPVTDEPAPVEFTVELWTRGDPSGADRDRPLVNWTGVFTLGVVQGEIVLKVGEAGGPSYRGEIMDGTVHHVAVTLQADVARLFVDGELQANDSDLVQAAAGGTLRIGCDGDGSFEGVLDELRISSVPRYTDSFAPSDTAFELDGDTWALFHFDEGEGEETHDEARNLVGTLAEVEWVTSDLGIE